MVTVGLAVDEVCLAAPTRSSARARQRRLSSALPNRPHWTIAALPGCLRGQARNPGRRKPRARASSGDYCCGFFWAMADVSTELGMQSKVCFVPSRADSTAGGAALCLCSSSCPRLAHERDRLGRPGQEISLGHQEVFLVARVARTSPRSGPPGAAPCHGGQDARAPR